MVPQGPASRTSADPCRVFGYTHTHTRAVVPSGHPLALRHSLGTASAEAGVDRDRLRFSSGAEGYGNRARDHDPAS